MRVTVRWFEIDGLHIRECPECFALVRDDRFAAHALGVHDTKVQEVVKK